MGKKDVPHRPETTGARCPKCGARAATTETSRPVGNSTYRVRVCKGCGHRRGESTIVLDETVPKKRQRKKPRESARRAHQAARLGW